MVVCSMWRISWLPKVRPLRLRTVLTVAAPVSGMRLPLVNGT